MQQQLTKSILIGTTVLLRILYISLIAFTLLEKLPKNSFNSSVSLQKNKNPQKVHRCPIDVPEISYSGPEISKSLFLYQRYTKGIQNIGAMEYGCPFAIFFL